MKILGRPSAMLLLAGLVGGCQAARDEARPAPPPSASAAARSTLPAAHAELDALDARTPVPLLPLMALHQKQNMQDHLLAVQEIVSAVAAENFEGVAAAARRIGHSPQMERMCHHMGASAPGFTERALAFHHTADGIGAAALARDERGVLSALAETLRACTGCHATYKQQLVAERPHY